MIKQLSDEEYKALVGYIPQPNYDVKIVAYAAHQNALREVVKWGDEDCPHQSTVLVRRRGCIQCWQELKEQAERQGAK